eukprot:COSAG06_NODE_12708_length_1340_cov_0.860596_3_plen_78_part_00
MCVTVCGCVCAACRARIDAFISGPAAEVQQQSRFKLTFRGVSLSVVEYDRYGDQNFIGSFDEILSEVESESFRLRWA